MAACQVCFAAAALPNQVRCGDCGGAHGAIAAWKPEPERSQTRSARYHRARKERVRQYVRPHTEDELRALNVLRRAMHGLDLPHD